MKLKSAKLIKYQPVPSACINDYSENCLNIPVYTLAVNVSHL